MDTNEIKLQELYANPPEDISLESIDRTRLPRHISFIMDGNGRWATSRGLERAEGHVAGVDSLRDTITACVRLRIENMSAYAFSTENWRRSEHEVNLLMALFASTMIEELPLFHENNVHLSFLGDLEALPKETQASFQRGLDETAHYTGMNLALAVNYGGRAEITRAAKQLAKQVQAGELDPDDITEELFASQLYTAGMPDPELLVRTSGELRISNYLLWQIAYSEMYVTDTFWPDFDHWELLRAIAAFQRRNRRFGGV